MGGGTGRQARRKPARARSGHGGRCVGRTHTPGGGGGLRNSAAAAEGNGGSLAQSAVKLRRASCSNTTGTRTFSVTPRRRESRRAADSPARSRSRCLACRPPIGDLAQRPVQVCVSWMRVRRAVKGGRSLAQTSTFCLKLPASQCGILYFQDVFYMSVLIKSSARRTNDDSIPQYLIRQYQISDVDPIETDGCMLTEHGE